MTSHCLGVLLFKTLLVFCLFVQWFVVRFVFGFANEARSAE